MLYAKDIKKMEYITDSEKEKLIKKFGKTYMKDMEDIKDIKEILWLDEGAMCISPTSLHVLQKEYGNHNLCYTKWNLDADKGCGYSIHRDEELISRVQEFCEYIGTMNMKMMTKKVLTLNINPHKEIDKVIEIANDYSRLYNIDINTIMENERRGFHHSYLLGDFLVSLYAINYSTSKTTILFRNMKYLDLVWKAIDGVYWKDILRSYYRYPDEDESDGIKRVKPLMKITIARGELEIKYKENWYTLRPKMSETEKNLALAEAEKVIDKKISCCGFFNVMGENFAQRFDFLRYDNIEFDKKLRMYNRIR